MSERITTKPEQYMLPKYERLEALPDVNEAEPLRKGEVDPLKLKGARETVQQAVSQDNPIERHEAAERAQQSLQPSYINRELKSITLQRELQQLRRKLPASERVLSQVIHQPIVRAVSSAASESLARPSGLLGGGLVAFFGTTIYFYLAKHIGFTYNYLVMILLFLGGFILGLLLEIIVWAFTSHHRHLD